MGQNSMMHLPEKELLRPDEVADYLRIHRRSVYRMVDEEILKSQKILNRIRIFRESVVDLVNKCDPV